MSTIDKHCRKHYGLKVLQSQHKDLRRLKREQETPNIHGNKLWGSCFVLMDYLEEHPLPPGSKIMELGCGWGLTGIYCARRQQAEVTAVDADPAVFPFLELFAQHNDVSIETRTARFERITTKELAQYDVLLAADICFWDELADTVYRLIRRAIKAGVKKIIIADPQRPPFHRIAEQAVEEFFADVQYWEVSEPRRFTGHLLIIENA